MLVEPLYGVSAVPLTPARVVQRSGLRCAIVTCANTICDTALTAVCVLQKLYRVDDLRWSTTPADNAAESSSARVGFLPQVSRAVRPTGRPQRSFQGAHLRHVPGAAYIRLLLLHYGQ